MLNTLLLVDDEPYITQALKRVLKRDGYQILTANSASEGLKTLQQNHVDMVISDQRMPIMSGTEFLTQVKEKHPKVERLMLSGYSDENSYLSAINEAKVSLFLQKPWDNVKIRHQINALFKELREQNQYDNKVAEKLPTFIAEVKHENEQHLFNPALFCHNFDKLISAQCYTIGQLTMLVIELPYLIKLAQLADQSIIEQLHYDIAQRLSSAFPDSSLTNFSCGHFALSLEIANNKDGITQAYKTISSLLSDYFISAGLKINFDVYIGFAFVVSNNETGADLLKEAKIAASQAKLVNSLPNWHVYTANIKTNNVQPLLHRSELAKAINNQAFILSLMPVIACKTLQVIGAELSIAWEHPLHCNISSEQYLTLAEKTEQFKALSSHLLELIGSSIIPWKNKTPLQLFYSLSNLQLKNNFGLWLSTYLTKHSLSPEYFTLEINDGDELYHDMVLKNELQQLSNAGFNILLTQVNINHISVERLAALPINTIKIPTQLIENNSKHCDNNKEIKKIISIAKQAQVNIVASGINTRSQAIKLNNAGCHLLSGSYFSRPLSATSFKNYVKTNNFNLW